MLDAVSLGSARQPVLHRYDGPATLAACQTAKSMKRTTVRIPFRVLFTLSSIALLAVGPRPALAQDCFEAAAQYHGVNPLILRAIAWQESHANAAAINHNANGSLDYGLMQINSIHLKRLGRYGIEKDRLMDPCASIYIAAWHLRSKMNKFGNSWQAVGAYHSETPALRDKYASQIIGILRRWQVLPSLTASR